MPLCTIFTKCRSPWGHVLPAVLADDGLIFGIGDDGREGIQHRREPGHVLGIAADHHAVAVLEAHTPPEVPTSM